ncbi:PRC-barrel domain containing protein [Halomicroarcula sp. F13]|uniref:PRC-barrel domain containing protein n=1 Tax=Haloarcula rubra TaxID=2487747 RepID=A0AAW4PMM1_9EURY|nr:PRC-barrel domain containing protein [Halomicroarcula rubra]MBX0322278.1 PRC-barrel domain containing protein [Halomicroarcula rubra]
MARNNLTERDEGKRVVNADGEMVGMISGFRGGEAYVDPDPGITDKIMSRLGWEDIDESDYKLDSSKVEHITDDEVRLESDL